MLGVVWVTNLYNFMDGIDGLAAGEAVTVGLVGDLLLARPRAVAGIGRPLLAARIRGLPASGTGRRPGCSWATSGSGFLGFLFGALAVAAENAGALAGAALAGSAGPILR